MASSSPPINSVRFREALGCFATGVAIITIRAKDAMIGLTVNSLASVSLEPPLLLWCLGYQADRFDDFSTAERFGLNILAADQHALSRRCAQPGRHVLAEDELCVSQAGTPLLSHAAAALECIARQQIPAGDHVIILAEVLAADIRKSAPLVYHQGGYATLAEKLPKSKINGG